MSSTVAPAYSRMATPHANPPHANPPHADDPRVRQLARLRQRAGLTAATVAARFGIPEGMLLDIEEGWHPLPHERTVGRWLRWLDDQASRGWEAER